MDVLYLTLTKRHIQTAIFLHFQNDIDIINMSTRMITNVFIGV